MSIVENPNDILDIDDRKTKVVHVKAWKKDIKIKVLSADAVTNIEKLCIDKKGDIDTKQWILQLVIHGVVKDDGTQVFTNSHLKALAGMSSSSIKFVADEVVKLNGLDDSTEDLAKN